MNCTCRLIVSIFVLLFLVTLKRSKLQKVKRGKSKLCVSKILFTGGLIINSGDESFLFIFINEEGTKI